ncbi:MAG: hypothetical protein VKP62_16720 [Candidatus Sericytochromatia bacterium]|nr:hypothetical protein [Candidatus Sericytochromatia bacterium]
MTKDPSSTPTCAPYVLGGDMLKNERGEPITGDSRYDGDGGIMPKHRVVVALYCEFSVMRSKYGSTSTLNQLPDEKWMHDFLLRVAAYGTEDLSYYTGLIIEEAGNIMRREWEIHLAGRMVGDIICSSPGYTSALCDSVMAYFDTRRNVISASYKAWRGMYDRFSGANFDQEFRAMRSRYAKASAAWSSVTPLAQEVR